MMYKKDHIEMIVDNYEILNVTDNFDGTCDIIIKMTNDQTTLVETLIGFGYKDDKWETTDVEKFVNERLDK